MLSPDTFAFTALLALLTALGPLAMDLYLPSLPAIETALGAPAAPVQLTISVYLIGFAVGQIAYGPVSAGSAAGRCSASRSRSSARERSCAPPRRRWAP